MKSKAYMFVLLIVIVVISSYSSFGYAVSQETHPESGNAMGTSDMRTQSATQKEEAEAGTAGQLKVSGDYIKAAMVAWEAFQGKLKSEVGKNPSPLDVHLSDLANYSTIISKQGDGGNYTVKFSPRPFQRGPIKGGGATYVVDSKTFRVLKREFSM